MILILSEDNDYPTLLVQEYLDSWGDNYFRLNESETISVEKIELSNNTDKIYLKVTNKQGKTRSLKLHEITAVWYRRGQFNLTFKQTSTCVELSNYYKIYRLSLQEYFEEYLMRLKPLNRFSENFLNKLNVLNRARQCGIKIPHSFLTSSMNNMPENRYITKEFVNPPFRVEDKSVYILTQQIANAPEHFFLSFIQKEIIKKYELRIFYLDRMFFSMAIFSQSNEKTKIDFRNYDFDDKLRMVPYELPKEIKLKLIKLMNLLCLKSGSIDLIVDENDDFIFLEVNPVGQWHFLSEYCNYNLEKHIAKYLSTCSRKTINTLKKS